MSDSFMPNTWNSIWASRFLGAIHYFKTEYDVLKESHPDYDDEKVLFLLRKELMNNDKKRWMEWCTLTMLQHKSYPSVPYNEGLDQHPEESDFGGRCLSCSKFIDVDDTRILVPCCVCAELFCEQCIRYSCTACTVKHCVSDHEKLTQGENSEQYKETVCAPWIRGFCDKCLKN